MITSKSLFYRAAFLTLACGVAGQAALAQGFINKKQDLPDAAHFYMARMQVQYVDDGPIVTHQSNPGSDQGGGGIPGVPPGLPKAGFQQYSNALPQLQTSLPKVNNGVPTKLPPQKPRAAKVGMKGSTGKLPTKPATKPCPQKVEAYAPYKGYNPANFGPAASASGASNNSSQSNVKGNVLHWSRAHHNTGGY